MPPAFFCSFVNLIVKTWRAMVETSPWGRSENLATRHKLGNYSLTYTSLNNNDHKFNQ